MKVLKKPGRNENICAHLIHKGLGANPESSHDST